MKKIFITPFLIAVFLNTIAQNGLDQTFGTNGFIKTFFPVTGNITSNNCEQVLADPDGSFYLVIHLNSATVITRRLGDGSLDQAYGEKGYSVPVNVGWGHAVLLPDGKIVIGGTAGTAQDFGMARITANGRLDSSFSGDGIQSTDFGSSSDFISAIALQNDGKIIAVGSFNNHEAFAIARYNTDGSPDNTFSGDGRQVTDFGAASTRPTSVAIDANGRIIVAGTAGGRFALAAYLPNGNADNQFSADGKETYSENPLSAEARAVAIQGDGKIVVAGYSAGGGDFNFELFRLNFDGSFDNSFSDDGKINLTLQSDKVEGLAIDNNDNILVSGSAVIDGVYQVFVARFTAAGVPDNSFSGDGFATAKPNFSFFAYGLAIQPNGRILVAGYHSINDAGSNFFAVRFNHAGLLDNSLDGDGILSDFKQYGHTYYYASAVQTDGKVITAGYARTSGYVSEFAIARYNTNGTLDNSFSQDGMATVAFALPAGSLNGSAARSIVIQSDGKIIIAGHCVNSLNSDIAIARLNTDGSPDNTFSDDGKQLTDFAGYDYATAVSLQADGKIVVAGHNSYTHSTFYNSNLVLARYNADGTPDNSFSLDGQLKTEVHGNASSLLFQPDGKILVVGGGWPDFFIARYLSDGAPDQSFGSDGVVRTDFGGQVEVASAVSLLSGGGIIVAGTSMDPGSYMAVAKFNSNGSPDLSFSSDGKVVLDPGSEGENCTSLALLPGGKIVLAGYNSHDLALVTLNADGTLDNSFMFPGSHFLDLGSPQDRIESVSIHNDRLYAAGSMIYGGIAGLLLAISIDCSLDATIPAAFALSNGVEPNTVYIGYAPASALRLKAESSTGTPPYKYLWSTGETTQSILVNPNSTTTYSVQITDAYGCFKSVNKTVNVVDVRCGNKLGSVLICQIPPGNPANAKTICINDNAVASQLANGSYLGNCQVNTNSSARFETIVEQNDFNIHVSPNPGSDIFTLGIRTNNNSKAELIIRDVLGRIIERRLIEGNKMVRIGSSYKPGTYLVEVILGKEKRIARIVKVSK